MNKEITDQLLSQASTILQMFLDGLKATKDFALEQLPDIAMQFILFQRAWLTFCVALATIILIVGITWCIKWIRISILEFNNKKDGSGELFIGVVGLIITALISVIMFINTLKPFFLVWFAPKVFLIQALVTLIKTGTF